MSSVSQPDSLQELRDLIQRHWGFSTFRPLQEQAMRAVLDNRDSLVVMPTGGGKSLCYQAPAALRGEITVVISPLISLMKDQVDSLRECGIAATQIDSSQSAAERSASEFDVMQGEVRLVFASPERLVTNDFCRMLRQAQVRTFAIDEAHCISHWGHDFRPEYRQMRRLKELFPGAAVHAYTATATQQVRQDIVQQLGLNDPEVLVGNFDRPNLSYRVMPRVDLGQQVLEVIDRHRGEAGIIYCIRRRDVDELSGFLQGKGYKALAYHAGLEQEQRRSTQDAFANEECDLVVATVAFGMGIDRSNIRFVLHTGMPKSIEHYQQETGRAGRDGLEAECVLLYSGADAQSWKAIVRKSAQEAGAEPGFLQSAMKHIDDMDRYARGAVCRHRALVAYFGQKYEAPSCSACDVCLGDTEPVPDALLIAQKILSCVARVKEAFGVNHIISVLRGEEIEAVRKRGHEKLSTFGLLRENGKTEIRDWIYQLISQQVLLQVGDEYPLLKLNDASWEVMKGQKPVRLGRPLRRLTGQAPTKSKAETISWEGVDTALFDALRELRKQLAHARGVPPFVIFHDSTLRELARVRPSSLERMRYVTGVGSTKLQEMGDRVLRVIEQHCQKRKSSRDNAAGSNPAAEPRRQQTARPSLPKQQAFDLFREGAVIEDVMHQIGRSRATTTDYLCDFIRQEHPAKISTWVDDEVYKRIWATANEVGVDRLKPIFLALGEKISYDEIRLVVAHMSRETNKPGDS